jgi:hypothetical protein
MDDIRVDVVARAFEGPCSDVIVTATKAITCLPPRVHIPVIRYSLQEARTAEVKVYYNIIINYHNYLIIRADL